MKREAGAVLSSIHLDRSSRKSISVQLYMGLRDLVLSGVVKPGDRLPASRTLAQETGVSRTTVVDAIDRLISEGMLVSRVGSGTFVSDTLESQRPPQMPVAPDSGHSTLPRLSNAITRTREDFAPRTWLPHSAQAFVTALPALDAFPLPQWSRIAARHLRGTREAVMGYGQPQGLDALRVAISKHLVAVRGIKCAPEQIFVTSGAQHAFSLIGQVFLNPGDTVWHENPGAKGARNAMVATGAKLLPVPIDDQGMNVAAGLARAPDFRLAFVTPAHQQPLGTVMSLARRLELLEAATQARAIIVEDDYDGEFHFASRPQPALTSIDRQGQVIYVGTFSKTLFPSLRLGFLLVPQRMVTLFDDLFASWVSGPPTSTQAIVADFMDEGHFATHIRMMRRLYKARYETVMEASAALPDTIRVQPASSGFHTTADLAESVDIRDLIAQARARGVVLSSLEGYCLTPIERKGLVLGFGSAGLERIRAGMETLATLPALRG